MSEKKILDLSEDDRPREKLMLKGVKALSDSELIAILIGSGNREQNAVELAQDMLGSCGHRLDVFARLSVPDLMRFKGIGEAKAISIVSALELGKRRKGSKVEEIKITSSKDVYEVLRPYLLDLNHEEFWVLALSRANKVMKTMQISKGGVSGTSVDSKVIFKLALEQRASAIILVHNHPSGQLKPSEADRRITKKLVEAGKLLEIPVLDHVIFCNEAYYSFADKGEL